MTSLSYPYNSVGEVVCVIESEVKINLPYGFF